MGMKPKEHICPSCGQAWIIRNKKVVLVSGHTIRGLIRDGLTKEQIAKSLGISIKLVKKEAANNGDGGAE